MTGTVIIIGFVQSVFGILLFITKRPKHLSFNILTVWLTVVAVFLGGFLLPFQVTEYFKPGLFPIVFLWGPLLYFYVHSLTIENCQPNWKWLLHALPVIVVGLHRTLVNPVSVTSTQEISASDHFFNQVYFILLGISLVVYWVLSLMLIVKHWKNIPFHFSNYNSKNSLSWLVFVVTLFVLFFLASLLIPVFEKVLNVDIVDSQILSLNLTGFAFIMIFFGINQTAIYSSEKYKHSSLDIEQIEKLKIQVAEYLSSAKPYLNPEFSLQMLAEDLHISRQKISQAINSDPDKNFYKIINELRVKEVREMIVNPAYNHYTLLGIAFDCGFNSKASFNRIFKEETGKTPSQFKKSLS